MAIERQEELKKWKLTLIHNHYHAERELMPRPPREAAAGVVS